MRKPTTVISSLVLAGFSFLAVPATTQAGSGVPQAGPFPVGNLLSYANSDFEGAANFVAVTNVSAISDDTAASFLHSDSLEFVSSSAGTTAVKLQEGTSPTQINLNGKDTYTVSAYIKIPATSGETVTFGLGQYDATGKWLGWASTPVLSLNGSGGWQYAEGQVKLAPTTAWVLGSPKITIGGAQAGQATNVDELTLRPYRAALAIGAHGECANPCTYSAADWLSTNTTIGPLQSDKEFFDASNSPGGNLPGNFNDTICWGIEQKLPQSQWPACIITWKGTTMTQADMNNFLSSVPSGQELYLVWYQEPEAHTFSYCNKTGGPAFVCEFDAQENLVRNSPGYTPNIFTAMDAASYQYGDPTNDTGEDNGVNDNSGTNGSGCSFIPPASQTDVYLMDFYENEPDGVQGVNVNSQTYREDNWKNWLSCVGARNRPLGFGEYGLDQCTSGNVSGTPGTMAADNLYLEGLGAATHEEVAIWSYWYSNYGGSAGCHVFTDPAAVSEWQSIETQNGGG